jgi:hypothetical protein
MKRVTKRLIFWPALLGLVACALWVVLLGSMRWRGRHLWTCQNGQSRRYVLFIGNGLMATPGSSAGEVHVYSSSGTHVTGVRFGAGYGQDLLGATFQENPRYDRKIMCLQTKGGFRDDKPIALYCGFIGDRLALLRTEEDGVLRQNSYFAPNYTVGPRPPHATVEKFVQALASADPFEVLETLVWLGGEHLNPLNRRQDTYQESTNDVRLYVALKQNTTVAELLTAHAASDDPWIRQAASYAITKKEMLRECR